MSVLYRMGKMWNGKVLMYGGIALASNTAMVEPLIANKQAKKWINDSVLCRGKAW